MRTPESTRAARSQEAHPFRVVAVELLLELSAFTGRLFDHMYNFQPDLVCHIADKRNLVAVRDWDNATAINETLTFAVRLPLLAFAVTC